MRNDLDASILKSGFPASDELLAFATKVCFQAKFKGGLLIRRRSRLVCLHEPWRGDELFSSWEIAQREKGILTDLSVAG